MATGGRVGSSFALIATVDLLLGFFLLVLIAVFASAVGSVEKAPPGDPPPPPDLAAFVAERVHQRLAAEYPDVQLVAHSAIVRVPGMFANNSFQLRTTRCRGPEDAQEGCVQTRNGAWVPASVFVTSLANVLDSELQHFVGDSPDTEGWRACAAKHGRPCVGRITTVFVEGHADRRAFARTGGTKGDATAANNSRLSLQRALAVYQQFERERSALVTLTSGAEDDPERVIAAAGFGCRRPAFNKKRANKDAPKFELNAALQLDERCPTFGDASAGSLESLNRRVELRFIVSLTREGSA